MAVAVATAAVLLPVQCGKLAAIVQLRRAVPNVSPSGADGATATTSVFVAFDRGPSAQNRFYATGGDVWEQRGRHRLLIRFSEAEPQLELDSYVTSIMYLNQRMNTLSFHPFEARMKYRRAVSETEQLFRRLGLHDGVNWEEYDQRLDSLIENREVYVPRIALPSATLELYLNCRWDYDALPRGQVEHVECYPIVYVTAKRP